MKVRFDGFLYDCLSVVNDTIKAISKFQSNLRNPIDSNMLFLLFGVLFYVPDVSL